MIQNLAIQVDNLSKDYHIRKGGKKELFSALEDVNFKVEKGTVTGVIGRNGAGKSTLLKVLSRITYPSRGKALVRGRLSSLLEVGTGFHPELSGKDNVYLNGALLGMNRAEIKEQYDAIIDFAGIPEFMETPVKHYSSGMYVRLAFSVAAHLRTDVLLIDEVLAVGDAAFQKKCLQRTEQVRKEEGRTVLFVSHNMSAVRDLCSEVIWLDRGKVRTIGDAETITANYLNDFKESSKSVPVMDRTDHIGTGDVVLTDLHWQTPNDLLISGEPAQLIAKYRSANGAPISNLHFRLNVFKENGEFLTSLSNEMSGNQLTDQPAEGEIMCEFTNLPFLAGEYHITSNILVSSLRVDQLERALSFVVEPGDRDTTGAMRTKLRAGIRVPQSWRSIK